MYSWEIPLQEIAVLRLTGIQELAAQLAGWHVREWRSHKPVFFDSC